VDRLMSREARKYLYTAAVAAMALLVAYDVISAESAPLWLALVTAVLGLAAPVTALANLTPRPSDIADSPEIDIEGE
jgi:hypothetical protein